MATKIVIDSSTGEAVEVELTPEEEAALALAQAATQQETQAAQWDEIRDARGVTLTQTDWIMAPPPDTPQTALDQIAANQQGWSDYRQSLRDLTTDTSVDPSTIVWPNPPLSPPVTVPPPPGFVPTPTTYPYNFATNNAPPPGNEQIRLNNYTMADVTAVYIDGTTADSVDVQAELAATPIGAQLTVQSAKNPDAYGRYRVTNVVDHQTWVEFTVIEPAVGTKIQAGGCTLEIIR